MAGKKTATKTKKPVVLYEEVKQEEKIVSPIVPQIRDKKYEGKKIVLTSVQYHETSVTFVTEAGVGYRVSKAEYESL